MKDNSKKVRWTAYNEKDVTSLLLSRPLISGNINSVKVSSWFNSRKKCLEFGIMARVINGNWCHLCTDTRVLIFLDIRLARKVCKAMREELKLQKCTS